MLRPISSITDEDAIEVAKIIHGIAWKERFEVERGQSRGCIIFGFASEIAITTKTFISYDGQIDFKEMSSTVFQFLIIKGYAVPIYPYKSTAIELGLAIDSNLK